ncbi:hypothetical protein [Natronorubrum bangense]|uniref:Uncharacterized protein n=1 Tax=Natronorubrum bangense JCM 10635 TaxID=1227500 RepID=L9VZ49_9EURY|nr:hypothetical protein [Natronorubrum bangense]ELY42317.1 hypothetical protein C494_20488 [Natronorubrum bangense JCM 10635]
MSNTPEHSHDSSDLSPAQRLEAPNTRLIDASIATIYRKSRPSASGSFERLRLS